MFTYSNQEGFENIQSNYRDYEDIVGEKAAEILPDILKTIKNNGFAENGFASFNYRALDPDVESVLKNLIVVSHSKWNIDIEKNQNGSLHFTITNRKAPTYQEAPRPDYNQLAKEHVPNILTRLQESFQNGSDYIVIDDISVNEWGPLKKLLETDHPWNVEIKSVETGYNESEVRLYPTNSNGESIGGTIRRQRNLLEAQRDLPNIMAKLYQSFGRGENYINIDDINSNSYAILQELIEKQHNDWKVEIKSVPTENSNFESEMRLYVTKR